MQTQTASSPLGVIRGLESIGAAVGVKDPRTVRRYIEEDSFPAFKDRNGYVSRYEWISDWLAGRVAGQIGA